MTEHEKVKRYFEHELILLPEESVESLEVEELKDICLKVFEERDVAVSQLEEIGVRLGQIMDDIKALKEKNIAEEYVPDTNVGKINEWIPCGERLPETNKPVLCWVKSITIASGETFIIGSCDRGFWFLQTYEIGHHHFPVKDYEIVAWRELPEPYQQKGE